MYRAFHSWHLLLFSQYARPVVSNFIKKNSEFVEAVS